MPTRNINLTVDQDEFIDEIVRLGKYQNASEAVRDAVRGLQHRLKADELQLDVLRAQLQLGLAALDRGDYTEIDDADLDAVLDTLGTDRAP